MSKRWYVVLSMGIVMILLLGACAPKATPAPTTAPAQSQATAAPAATVAEATAAATTAATTAATAVATTAPSTGAAATLTLWHGWTDPNELALLDAVVQAFKGTNPNVTMEILAVPFQDLKNKFTTEASTGGGPDLLIGPKDWIGEMTTAKLIAPLDDVAADILADLNPAAVEANKFNNQVMALPESVEAVVLWYNKDLVPNPPTNTEELLTITQQVGMAFNTQFYHTVGFLYGFGGSIFDENEACMFTDGTAAADWLAYLKQITDIDKVVATTDQATLDAAFKDGQVGLTFNGPWATGDYAQTLGREKLAVAPPLTITKSGQTFAPFLGTKNIFLSANTTGDEQAAALAFMRTFVSPEIQGDQAIKAGHIPVNQGVTAEDPIVAGIIAQTESASYFPNEPEMGAVWTPAGDMITKVIEGRSTPEEAVAEACTTINAANNK